MNLKVKVAITLIALSWPICLVHRFLNSNPPFPVNPILFDSSLQEDLQWLIYDVGNMLSQLFFIFGTWLVIKRVNAYLYIVVSAALIVSVLDLVHYITYYKRNEYFVFVEGLVWIVASVKIYLRSCKQQLK